MQGIMEILHTKIYKYSLLNKSACAKCTSLILYIKVGHIVKNNIIKLFLFLYKCKSACVYPCLICLWRGQSFIEERSPKYYCPLGVIGVNAKIQLNWLSVSQIFS